MNSLDFRVKLEREREREFEELFSFFFLDILMNFLK